MLKRIFTGIKPLLAQEPVVLNMARPFSIKIFSMNRDQEKEKGLLAKIKRGGAKDDDSDHVVIQASVLHSILEDNSHSKGSSSYPSSYTSSTSVLGESSSYESSSYDSSSSSDSSSYDSSSSYDNSSSDSYSSSDSSSSDSSSSDSPSSSD